MTTREATKQARESWRAAIRSSGATYQFDAPSKARQLGTETVIIRGALPCGASAVFVYDEPCRREVKISVQGVDRFQAAVLLDRFVAALLEEP